MDSRLTVPQSPALQTAQRAMIRCSVAASTNFEFSGVHTTNNGPSNTSIISTIGSLSDSRAGGWKLTVPKSPKLLTTLRACLKHPEQSDPQSRKRKFNTITRSGEDDATRRVCDERPAKRRKIGDLTRPISPVLQTSQRAKLFEASGTYPVEEEPKKTAVKAVALGSQEWRPTVPHSPHFLTAVRASVRAPPAPSQEEQEEKPPKSTYDPTRLTRPLSPQLATAMRAKLFEPSVDPALEEPVPPKKDKKPSSKPGEPWQPTVPHSPKLLTSERARLFAPEEPPVEPAHEDSRKPAHVPLGPTRPVSPKLMTAVRASIRAPELPPPASEVEQPASQKPSKDKPNEPWHPTVPQSPKLQTKARAKLTESISVSTEATTGQSQTQPKKKTVPAGPPQLATEQRAHQRGFTIFCDDLAASKAHDDTERETHQFKALPLNRKILESHGELGVPRVEKPPLTVPESPALATRERGGRIPPPKEEVFVFKARPMPDHEPFVPKLDKKDLTIPQSPALATKARSTVWPEPEVEQPFVFKARPLPVKAFEEPFVPKKSNRPLTEISNITLNSSVRASQRQAWEQTQKEKEAAARLLEEERERERKLQEEKELRELRKKLTFKAQPVRRYKPVEIHPAMQPLTQPQSPALRTKARVVLRDL